MNQLDKNFMIESYRNISFNGERRGENDFEYYSNLLKEDLEKLGENKGKYEEKFIRKVMLIFQRQSRCASSMIVGPARFNVSKHEKLWQSTDRARDDFYFWRTKYFKLVNRERTLSPEAETDKCLEELERLENRKIIFQQADKIKDKDEKIKFLESESFLVNDVMWCIEKGYKLSTTNLTTKIRERKKRLEILKNRIKRKETFEKLIFKGGFIDIENDRVIIVHDEKPSREVIERIKSSGFRYSPKMKNWCRKHTGNAIYETTKLLYPFLSGASV